MHKPPHPPPHTPLANHAAKQLEVKLDGRWCQRNKPSSTHHWKDKHVLSAVQRMAQAHLSSLDTSSVDREDLSSGGEEEETGQSRISNTGNTDTFSASGHLTPAFVLQTYILAPSHRNLFFFFEIRFKRREQTAQRSVLIGGHFDWKSRSSLPPNGWTRCQGTRRRNRRLNTQKSGGSVWDGHGHMGHMSVCNVCMLVAEM